MSTIDPGVQRAEGYLYGSLHQAFPVLPAIVILVSLDGPTTPIGWLVGWALLVLAAAWAGLTVLHTRLRDLALLPPSRWDVLFRSRRRRTFLVAWLLLSVAAAGVSGLFAPADALLLGSSCAILGGVLALPALLVGVRTVDSLPATRRRTGLAVAEERVRFSRDLHDVFGRTLSAVALRSELAAAQAERGRPEAADTMREVQAIAVDALAEVREVVRGYREADLTSEVAGARSLLEAAGSAVTTTHEGAALLPAPVARAFAWTVREAATNILRHADATTVRIAVTATDRLARLEVVNDRPPPPSEEPGSGLAGLAERLSEVGGTLTWRNRGDAFALTATVDAPALARLRTVLNEET